MKKVGILGSSFSVGSHHNYETKRNDLALPFESWLVKHTRDIEFFNAACSGKGTELYLNKIVYLKKHHNVDLILMELVNNRSMINVKSQHCDLENISDDVYQDNYTIWEYVRGISQPIDYSEFATDKEFKIWQDFQYKLAYNFNAFEFWGILDCKQAIELCKMLNIKVVTWQKSFDFREHIRQDIKFDNFANAHDYYVDKYDDASILCDQVHFKDEINDEMVRDFIAPKILEILNDRTYNISWR